MLGAAKTRTFGQQIHWLCCAIVVLLFHAACSARAPNTPGSELAERAAAKKAQESTTDSSLPPGEYITEKGWGRLHLTKKEILTFSIESTVGEDICSLSGEIKDGRGIADNESGPSGCVVSFTENGKGIDVSASTPSECKQFCGYNGGFEATFIRINDGCGQNEIKRAREDFKNLYDSKSYKPALARLSPLLRDCLPTLEWEEEGSIRNDLAIVQYKNGQYDACLETLDQYAEDAKKDDSSVVEEWMPALADRYLSIVKAARTNIALCSKKSTNK